MNPNTPLFVKLTLLLSLICIIIIILISCSIWDNTYEKQVKQSGGLARIGWIPMDSQPSSPDNISIHRIEWIDYFENPERYDIDLLIVGDSFSNSGNLPEYLATHNNMQVLAVRTAEVKPMKNFSPINLLIAMDNGGIIDIINPSIIILEQVERSEYIRTNDINFYESLTIDELERAIRMYNTESKNLQTYEGDINQQIVNGSIEYKPPNLHYEDLILYEPNSFFIEKILSFHSERLVNIRQIILSQIWIQFTGHSYKTEDQPHTTYRLKLLKPLFSSFKDLYTLYFLSDDLDYLEYSSDTIWIYQLNCYLNILSNRFAERNISFYYIPATDKFDFYYSYINKNLYPPNPYYEQMEGLYRSYHYINPKEILENELLNGKQDLYWLGDTHWSWMAVEILSRDISPLNKTIIHFSSENALESLPEDEKIFLSYAYALINSGEPQLAIDAFNTIIKENDDLSRKILFIENITGIQPGCIDKIVEHDGTYEVSGWAIDPITEKPAQYVFFTETNNEIVGVGLISKKRYGVVNFFKNEALLKSGWTCDIDREIIDSGIPVKGYVFIPERGEAYRLKISRKIINQELIP